MNGYSEEGFEEWVELERKNNPSPPWVELIMMEEDLGLPHIDERKVVDNERAWAYYRELKARLEQQQRRTA